jgi:hypothetical protein
MRQQRPAGCDDAKNGTDRPQTTTPGKHQRRSVMGFLRKFRKSLSAKEITAAVSIAATAALGIYNFVNSCPPTT